MSDTLRRFNMGRSGLRLSFFGTSGCHRAGQGILMFDGSVKPVEQVNVGDRIMGPDGAVRTAIGLCRGRGRMVEIIPVKGSSWVVNEEHVLTLVRTNACRSAKYPRRVCLGGEVLDVSVREWLKWSKNRKRLYKLFRVGVDKFGGSKKRLPIRPYHLGLLLGDGGMKYGTVDLTTSESKIMGNAEEIAKDFGLRLRSTPAGGKSVHYIFTSGHSGRGKDAANPLKEALTRLGLRYNARHGAGAGDKFVPERYKTASVAARLAILAGLLDTDGHLDRGCYDHVTKSPRLARDMVFLARSVGLAAYVAPCVKSSQRGTKGVYYRISISGHTDRIPCRLPQKQAALRRQRKDAARTGFTVRRLGIEEYYGFTLTGDGRYLLDDFTVTHNSGKSTCFGMAKDAIRERVGGHMKVYRADVAGPLREIQFAAYRSMGLADPGHGAENMPQDGRLLSLLASHFGPHLGRACCSFVDSVSQAHPARDAAFVNTDCRDNAYDALHDFGFWFVRVEADADTVRRRVAQRCDLSPYDPDAAVERIGRIKPYWVLHNDGALDELREAVGRVVQAAVFSREEFLSA